MSAEAVDLWLKIIVSVLSVGAIIYSWLTARSSANAKQLADLHAVIEALARRVQQLESDARHAPAKDDVHRLAIDVAEMKGEVGKMTTAFSAIASTVQRVEGFLLERSGRKP